MRIKKVKITKENKIHVAYEDQNKSGDYDEYTFTCSDQATPSFYAALQDLATHVIETCELPEDYEERIIINGVSLSYGGDNDTMGATIIAQMKLSESNVNLNLNTPHKIEEFYSEHGGDEKQLMSGRCVDSITDLLIQCEKYIKGDRAQGELFREKVEPELRKPNLVEA